MILSLYILIGLYLIVRLFFLIKELINSAWDIAEAFIDWVEKDTGIVWEIKKQNKE